MVIRNCVQCLWANPVVTIIARESYIPELRHRVTTAIPFSIVRVDYAGPFRLKDRQGRGCKVIKVICLFICFVAKAMHLELLTGLSTESLLSVLRRFASRRGTPSRVYSDNATNFVGAHTKLNDLHSCFISSNDQFVNACTNVNIVWQFIPLNSPHFGSFRESLVKGVKHHLT